MKKLLTILSILISCAVNAQIITGGVIDVEKQPIPAVTVSIKGKKTQASTDQDGKFSINSEGQNTVLVFSGINIQTKSVEVGDKREITVVLVKRETILDEVQIVGYGTSTQRLNIGSVTKIKAEDIERQLVSNPLAALQGRVPGLDISATSGVPGSSFKVQLRGQNTINTSRGSVPPMDNPLYIIDGVPFAAQNNNVNQFASLASPGVGDTFNNAYGGLSPFNSINPADIESIEILRDADATAIYGSRGGNGVILITTKKGKQGKTELAVNGNVGVSVIGHTLPMMNTKQFLEMRNEAYVNDGLVPSEIASSSSYAPDLLIFDSNRDVNWTDEFFGSASYNSTFNIGLKGGAQYTQFRFGGNYNKSSFSLPGGFYDQKTGLSLGIHHDTNNKKISFDFSGTYNNGKNNSSSGTNLLLTSNLQPNYPVPFDDDGNLVWYYKGVSLNGGTVPSNPYAYLMQKYEMNSDALNANLLISYRPLKGLSVKTSLGISSFLTDEYKGVPKKSLTPQYNYSANANFGNSSATSWIIEPQATYNREFQKLEIESLIGGTLQASNNSSQSVYASGYISDELIRSISGAPNKNASDNFNEYRYSALFSRLKMNFDRRYLFSANFRRDGSSRFGSGRQFGNFGSVGFGWLFNEEKFIKESLSFLSYGKLRTSYGITGSDGIGDYNYLSRWEPSYFNYGGTLGFSPLNHANDEFGWASTKKLELGVELGFLDDRFLLSVAWYRNRTGNQLVNYTLPISTGFSKVVQNWGAKVENKGSEAVLQASISKTPTFSWSSSFNISLPKNQLISFPGLEESAYSTMYTIGRSLSSLYLYKYAGVDKETGIFTFYKEDGTVTSTPKSAQSGQFNDMYYVGKTDPEFFGGLSNTFSFRSIRLDIFMDFKKQIGKNYLGQVYYFYPGERANMPVELLNRWQKEGDQAAFQKYSTLATSKAGRANQVFAKSDAVYGDASYLRLRNVTISYEIPANYIKRIGLKHLNTFVNAQNLFTITNYKGNNPETQSFYGVPPLSSFNFGIQMKF
ncbi:SusC/RagA family TonB-linked outer membrane protein [Sphingobacterium faecale]|uniref:SusC/RagA family TonB-linked outer membrane protein n=1 Tax=Sphingobacterium faecale TaxID=2803775 RepID=A0ABS1R0U0_9SPHI|nr:SusC/RagA family TonB-linked outer membrane protein [Sphingobacterium faecale]MBL1407516.1 SusC/RagA family TonB-linked outer membrane protein [Sphingobacterium faecale]